MVIDDEIVPVTIEGVNGDFYCDFCGEKKICAANVRGHTQDGEHEITTGIGICATCSMLRPVVSR